MNMSVRKITAIEDTPVVLLARVFTSLGNPIQQTDIASIQVKSYDITSASPDTAILNETVEVASAVYDELQHDSRWVEDAMGYNLAVTLDGAAIPQGSRVYGVEVEVEVQPTEDSPLRMLWQITTIERWGG